MGANDSVSATMHQLLSSHQVLSKTALRQLMSFDQPLPSSTAGTLFDLTLSARDSHSLHMFTTLLERMLKYDPDLLNQKLISASLSLHPQNTSLRQSFNAVSLACALINSTSDSAVVLKFLLASLSVLHRIPAPASGSQVRAKRKALQRTKERLLAISSFISDSSSLLLTSAERYSDKPDEAVSAIVLLSSSFECLDKESQRDLVHHVTILSLRLPDRAKLIAQECKSALEAVPAPVVLSTVLPLVERALIREPQTTLETASDLFQVFVPLNLSTTAVMRIIPSVVQSLKSSDSGIRSHGILLLRSISPHIQGEEQMLKAVGELLSVLKNSRYVYQRISVLDATTALVASEAGHIEVANFVLNTAFSLVNSKRETKEEVRGSAFRLLLRVIYQMSRSKHGSFNIPPSFQPCLSYLRGVLSGAGTESDQRTLLVSIMEQHQVGFLPMETFGGDVVTSLSRSIISNANKSNKHEIVLHGLTLLCDWSTPSSSSKRQDASPLPSSLIKLLGDPESCPVLRDQFPCTTDIDALCKIRCLVWIIQSRLKSMERAAANLFSLSLNSNWKVSRCAQEQIQFLQSLNSPDERSQMFLILWGSQFSGAVATRTVSKSYSFDDGMGFAEKLGHTLLSTVLPCLPLNDVALIFLAANHPRIVPNYSKGRLPSPSRFWAIIESTLEPVEQDYSAGAADDWLCKCLHGIFGPQGLQSRDPTVVQAALNGLGTLSLEQNPYATRVIRHTAVSVGKTSQELLNLPVEALDALRIVQEAEESYQSKESKGGDWPNSLQKKPSKKASDVRKSVQEKQAEVDRARAATATANALAEKVKNAQQLASTTVLCLEHARNALLSIIMVGTVSPAGAHSLIASFLPVVLSLVRFETLDELCREGLVVLSNTASSRLKNISADIAVSLFLLEKNQQVEINKIASLMKSLDGQIPPAFAAEDFTLIAPIVRNALFCSQNSVLPSGIKGPKRKNLLNDRDSLDAVKTAARILAEHCKPEAVDAAVSAAGLNAGLWVISVLEREDAAFAVAADALAFLTATALTPASPLLDQVIRGVYSGKSSVRDATLNALSGLPPLSSSNIECPRDAALGRALWYSRFDPDEGNAQIAEELWNNFGHPLYVSEDAPLLLVLAEHTESDVRLMSAKAVAHALIGTENNTIRSTCIRTAFKMYVNGLPRISPEQGTLARQAAASQVMKRGREPLRDSKTCPIEDSNWHSREGVALVLESMAKMGSLSADDISVCFAFLAGQGLGDEHNDVRAHMSKAAVAIVEAAGELGPSTLLPVIEKQLNIDLSKDMTPAEILHADRTRENLVMCLGSVASFLPAEDFRIGEIADQVVKTAMETPSEVVQNAAARCLIPLASSAFGGAREVDTTKYLLSAIWNQGKSYGQRRGSAYALAGICSGLGLRYVCRSMIMSEVGAALTDKSPLRREGAFILIETCALLMGRLYEPYVVRNVPHMLACMSDSVMDVRNACWSAAQAAMSELSSQGVKLVLPSLINGLKDRQWRTRAGSAEVLGAMAYCAPRQLALCLPQVVPKLAEVLADAHPSVTSSAEAAISRIAAVVRSPEVRKLSPFLLAALRDPAGRTQGAIDAMLGSEFSHAIDAASLALLVPPLHRGLRDRSSVLKRRSAAIVGSMCNNVANHSDVEPYLDLLLPALRVTLLDAIPDVRRTSAKALGALATSLGEKGLPDIVPWLISALLGNTRPHDLSSDEKRSHVAGGTFSAERAGAAMGLAEVSVSMSERRLEDVLTGVMTAGESSAESREGCQMFIAALPGALGERFERRIGKSLSTILKGLSDDADIVREAALVAGRNMVSAYAKTSLERLLPELLRAMGEKSWRIRQAATRLLGDLLLVVAGARPERSDLFGVSENSKIEVEDETERENDGDVSIGGDEGDSETDENDESFTSPEEAAAAMSVESTMKAIEEVLGTAKRNEVLAALYIARCDVSVHVRQTAMQVWKSVVSNTPRVLKEIMPSAVRQIVDGLGDEDDERRGAAGKTLGDLAQKLGDRVVPEILPALKSGIIEKGNSERIRRGACEGLGELVFACQKQQLEEFADDFIDAVFQGLVDELGSVRRIAAEVFPSLLKLFGTRAVDFVVPRLVDIFGKDSYNTSIAQDALDGLKLILRSSGTRLTNIVIPRLISERPITDAIATVIASAAIVSESGFEPHVAGVTNVVVDCMEQSESIENERPLEPILSALASCGDHCSKSFFDEVFTKYNDGYPARRAAASRVLAAYCRAANPDHVAQNSSILLGVIVRQLADTEETAASHAWKALKQLSDTIDGAALSQHLPVIRQSLRSAASGGIGTSDSETVLGLQVPKSPAPFVPIVSEGLLHGTPELKEQAALCIDELVELTNLQSLGPYVIKLLGPLIRSLSGRMPWQVKAAILKALLALIKKGPRLIKSFVPQLQSSFVKCLSDSNRLVRVRGCGGLAGIIPLQTRLDPLLTELTGLALNGSTAETRSAAFRACSQVFRLGNNLPDDCFPKYSSKLCQGLVDEDEDVWRAAGKCVGFLAKRATDKTEFRYILDAVMQRLELEECELSERISILHGLGAIILSGIEIEFLRFSDVDGCAIKIVEWGSSSMEGLQRAACATIGDLVMLLWKFISNGDKEPGVESLWRQCVFKLGDLSEYGESGDVRIAALSGLKRVIEVSDEALKMCVEHLVVCAGATNTGVREQAERTMRRAFVKTENKGDIIWSRVELCNLMLNTEDSKFLERKVSKLIQLGDSGDEQE